MQGSGRPNAGRNCLRAAAAVVVALAMAAAVVTALLWHQALTGANTSVVQSAASQVRGRVSAMFLRYEELAALSAQGLGSGDLTPQTFGNLLDGPGLAGHVPGLMGIAYVPRTPTSALPGVVAATHGAGTPTFTVLPPAPLPEFCLPTLAQWTARVPQPPAAGTSTCSPAWARRAMRAIERSGGNAVLPEEVAGRRYASDFVVVEPYVAGGSPSGAGGSPSGAAGSPSVAGHEAAVEGWSAALVDGAKMLGFVGSSFQHAAESLYAGPVATRSALVASSTPGNSPVAGTRNVPVLPRTSWTVRTAVLSGYPGLSSAWTVPVLVLSGGMVLVLALAALGWTLVRARTRAEVTAEANRLARARSEARFEALAGASPMGILETNRALEVTYLNPRLEVITGRPAAEIIGRQWVGLLHADDRTAFLDQAAAAVQSSTELDTTVRIVRPTGEIRTVRVLAAGLRERPDGEAHHYSATIEDVSERVALHEQLRHQALHDDLTGLPNRTLFADRLEQAMARAARTGQPPAVLFLDVDHFKTVNDSLGHKAGDKLLVQLADRLRQHTRGGESVARLGGDEFAVLLPDATGVDVAVTVADRLLRAVQVPFRLQGRDIVAGVSIGIVLVRPGDDPDTALRNADAAMYRAKEDGRGRYAVFQQGLHERSLARLTMEGELRQGLQRGEFEVFLQPVLALASNEVIGAEALLRWRHPTRGLLNPGAFVPVAEESGLIVPLGQWAYGAALGHVAAFDADPDGPHLQTIAINLSSHQLRNPALDAERRSLIRRHGIAHNRICAELTETLVMDDSEVTRRTLQEMSDHGITIAIDDFGTGYSSLAYLHTLPVRILKIDRRFVAGVGTQPGADAIVAAIIEMAHRLGLTVIAEGVEEEVQRHTLVDLGCDAAQGFLWAKPMPADEFREWCRDRRPVAWAVR